MEPDLDLDLNLEPGPELLSHHSAISAMSYFTTSEEASIMAVTEGSSILLVHCFTLIKPGTITKRLMSSSGGGGSGVGEQNRGLVQVGGSTEIVSIQRQKARIQASPTGQKGDQGAQWADQLQKVKGKKEGKKDWATPGGRSASRDRG